MDTAKIYYCRECRPSHHLLIKNLKNSFLEKSSNVKEDLPQPAKAILEDYAWKNVVKRSGDFSALARMAVEAKKEWKKGRTLTVSFMGGSKEVRDRLIRHAKRWMDFANINFDFTPRKKPGDIRISFNKKDGSWSFVGTEILSVPKNQATMNFGWLSPTLNDIEFHQVVLHEFGHTLGCIHEHQRPDNGIPWDKPKVYSYYAQVDGWTKEEVDEQVFDKYDISLLRANIFDKDSIMMYPVPENLTKGKFSIGWNSNLSAADKKFIAKLYPR